MPVLPQLARKRSELVNVALNATTAACRSLVHGLLSRNLASQTSMNGVPEGLPAGSGSAGCGSV